MTTEISELPREAREDLVRIRNSFALASSKMTAAETKILYTLISEAQRVGEQDGEYSIDIKDIVREAGVDKGNTYNFCKKATEKLSKISYLHEKYTSELLPDFRWVQPIINPGYSESKKQMVFSINPMFRPLIFFNTSKGLFSGIFRTQMKPLKKQHSITMLQLIETRMNHKTGQAAPWKMTIEDFNKLFGTNYEKPYDMKRRILIPTENEFKKANLKYSFTCNFHKVSSKAKPTGLTLSFFKRSSAIESHVTGSDPVSQTKRQLAKGGLDLRKLDKLILDDVKVSWELIADYWSEHLKLYVGTLGGSTRNGLIIDHFDKTENKNGKSNDAYLNYIDWYNKFIVREIKDPENDMFGEDLV